MWVVERTNVARTVFVAVVESEAMQCAQLAWLFFLGLHSVKGLLLLRALVCSVVGVRPMEVTEEFFVITRRSTTSAPSSAATSDSCSGRRLLIICALVLWWCQERIEGHLVLVFIRRFQR